MTQIASLPRPAPPAPTPVRRPSRRVLSAGSRLLALVFALAAPLAGLADTALEYTPLSIPTRDGKSLAADLYYADPAPQPKPVILIQTPYNKNYYRTGAIPGQGGGKSFPVDADYNYVVVDWRGFYGSAAAAVPGYDRGLDGYDCVEWIASQPWSNGKVGTWGSSALGLIQYQTASHHPPHLVCINPQVKDFQTQYEDDYYGGDYRKEQVETIARLGFVTTAAVQAHPDEDAFWRLAQAATAMAPDIAVPALVVGGWYDHYPSDVLRSFQDLVAQSDPSVRAKHRLIVGPWTHSGVDEADQGVLTYPDATALYGQEIQFWDYYLRGVADGWDQTPAVTYYQMGENAWHTASSWADLPREDRALYLQPGGLLAETPPPAGAAPDAFVYDPSDPTPSLGGARFNPFDPSIVDGPQDLSQAIETRGDVVVSSTPVLDQDLRLNGDLSVRLYVSSDRTDTDLCVRLCDVYPDGRSLITTQGIRRLRFRDSFSTETLMTPGQIYPVTVELQDLALTFLAGHRLRIDVCSADCPMYDANRNDGGPMYVTGPAYPATNTIYHDADHPSAVLFQTLPSVALTADFGWAPQNPSAGAPVTFTASASGGTPPYTIAWDLDGAAAAGQSATQAFDAGSRAVTLTVTDDAGGQVTVTKTLAVLPAVVLTSVTPKTNPFRLKISGGPFQAGCQVLLDGQPVPQTVFKSASLVVAKGSGFKAMVPKGTPVQVAVLNPDGSRSPPLTYTR